MPSEAVVRILGLEAAGARPPIKSLVQREPAMIAGPLAHSSAPFCRHEVWGRWNPGRRIVRSKTVLGRLLRATGHTVVGVRNVRCGAHSTGIS
jgi:hypothetical protein